MTENELAKIVVDVAYRIHTTFGPGLFESVYHTVMVYELRRRGFQVKSKHPVPLIWQGAQLDAAFQADVIVDDKIVLELKSIEAVGRVHKKTTLDVSTTHELSAWPIDQLRIRIDQGRNLACRQRP